MLRPRAKVLPASAQLPDRNLIVPPPNRFTHEVIVDQPYYYTAPRRRKPPDGEFAAGTKVVLLVHDGGKVCRVADGRGLYVATAFAGLRPLD
jgi:hypothetical protein